MKTLIVLTVFFVASAFGFNQFLTEPGDDYGTLVIEYLPDAAGTVEITVRATDTDGMSVDTQFAVTVNPVDDPPTLAAELQDL